MRLLFIILLSFGFSEKDIIKAIKFHNEAEIVSETKKVLDVPDFYQSPNAVPQGWCGSTAIQMVLSYYGFDYSQEVIIPQFI